MYYTNHTSNFSNPSRRVVVYVTNFSNIINPGKHNFDAAPGKINSLFLKDTRPSTSLDMSDRKDYLQGETPTRKNIVKRLKADGFTQSEIDNYLASRSKRRTSQVYNMLATLGHAAYTSFQALPLAPYVISAAAPKVYRSAEWRNEAERNIYNMYKNGEISKKDFIDGSVTRQYIDPVTHKPVDQKAYFMRIPELTSAIPTLKRAKVPMTFELPNNRFGRGVRFLLTGGAHLYGKDDGPTVSNTVAMYPLRNKNAQELVLQHELGHLSESDLLSRSGLISSLASTYLNLAPIPMDPNLKQGITGVIMSPLTPFRAMANLAKDPKTALRAPVTSLVSMLPLPSREILADVHAVKNVKGATPSDMNTALYSLYNNIGYLPSTNIPVFKQLKGLENDVNAATNLLTYRGFYTMTKPGTRSNKAYELQKAIPIFSPDSESKNNRNPKFTISVPRVPAPVPVPALAAA